ncbi:MAG: hypothetical protein LBS38_01080 [Endomicrobium sp.]|jgi:hypothetical protein|nr:hypothetical protein [Endomicrobium sp.]MDR2398939.1 hypothetical protein [Endomicrobium sp.]
MTNKKGQALIEVVLIFVALLIATTGVLAIYKSFWKTKYKKVSFFPGTLVVGSSKVNYVK